MRFPMQAIATWRAAARTGQTTAAGVYVTDIAKSHCNVQTGQLGRRLLLQALLAPMLTLQGCASFWDARAEYKAGWRDAYVLEPDVGNKRYKSLRRDCRVDGGNVASAGQQFALVGFRSQGRQHLQAVLAVPRNVAPVGERQTYRVNIDNCSLPWRNGH